MFVAPDATFGRGAISVRSNSQTPQFGEHAGRGWTDENVNAVSHRPRDASHACELGNIS
jgi:hypothetical protein